MEFVKNIAKYIFPRFALVMGTLFLFLMVEYGILHIEYHYSVFNEAPYELWSKEIYTLQRISTLNSIKNIRSVDIQPYVYAITDSLLLLHISSIDTIDSNTINIIKARIQHLRRNIFKANDKSRNYTKGFTYFITTFGMLVLVLIWGIKKKTPLDNKKLVLRYIIPKFILVLITLFIYIQINYWYGGGSGNTDYDLWQREIYALEHILYHNPSNKINPMDLRPFGYDAIFDSSINFHLKSIDTIDVNTINILKPRINYLNEKSLRTKKGYLVYRKSNLIRTLIILLVFISILGIIKVYKHSIHRTVPSLGSG